MKLKLLLFVLLLSGGILNAQDTIRGLIITEAQFGNQPDAYFEITNMGDVAVNLNVIEWGEMTWSGGLPWNPNPDRSFMLPDFMLEPGASFVISGAWDFEPEQFAKGLDGYREKVTKDDMWDLADMLIHVEERNSIPGLDSIFEPGSFMFNDICCGRSCFFIRQHINETDSVVLDQVGGVFGEDGGYQADNHGYDVAGVTVATDVTVLVRKFSVKNGNLDFASARGIGEDDSEWIALKKPRGHGITSYRSAFWTVGSHGDYILDENTLVSGVADVDFAAKTITVPWGTRRGDGVMKLMDKTPGVSWYYSVSPVVEDTLSFAAHTGDQLEITVCGDVRHDALFDIIVTEPDDANIVVPVSNMDPLGYYQDDHEFGVNWLPWPRVTENESGIDTIYGDVGGIPYATRADTLLDRLDKATNATWDFEFADGVIRADLKEGDMLKVTASDGSVKSYYISVTDPRPSHEANLVSITWPDIPDFYRGIFGWIGDTIPSFSPTGYNYKIQVPLDVDGIPGLVAKTLDLNAKVQVDRAANLSGTTADRTVTFNVQAEDDTTFRTYNVEIIKEKDPVNLQPYYAEPFLSELVFWDQWSNSFGEICNPGNQPLDLSNYMIAMQNNVNPAEVIASNMDEEDWINRYDKYVPGYKWVDEAHWAVTPGILEQDLNVNPIVMAGDVFCFGGIHNTAFCAYSWVDLDWPLKYQLDIQFNNHYGSLTFENPWGEEVGGSPIRKWNDANWYMFKILNDSIKAGLKPANDPNDFELIETFGMADGSTWVIGGLATDMIMNWSRKPDIYKGNTVLEGSFGTDPENSEWTWTNSSYWRALGNGWPFNILSVAFDIGKHFFNTPTHYMSTVSSVLYKVSAGYGKNGTVEEIRGMAPGTTTTDFLSNLIKANEDQTLTVKGVADGMELAMDALISMNDTLVVLSADSTNTTNYVLEVAEGGLSSNAVLTSTKYDIEIQSDPKSAGSEAEAGAGTITSFEYGTSLKTIIANITTPAGAGMDMIDGAGAYVPLKMLNFDTTYVNVTVNSDTYFEVTAENGVTKIVYQLIPDVSEKDAFITSNVYSVVQKDVLIHYVPRGTAVQTFLSNLVASAGATMQLVDKLGLERVDGNVADDDKVIVTSPNGEVTKVYFISMLAEKYVPETTYLAYILSARYAVDQVDYVVDNIDGGTTLADFYSKITPSMGATAVVVDKDGNEKTSGDVLSSDEVQVTSADGKIVIMYTIAPLTSTDIIETNNIELYPNPTNGNLNISGVERGNRIQIFNTNGSVIRDIVVGSSIEVVSLHKEPAWIFR